MSDASKIRLHAGRLSGSGESVYPPELCSVNGYYVKDDMNKVINLQEFFRFVYLDRSSKVVDRSVRDFFVYKSGGIEYGEDLTLSDFSFLPSGGGP